jgi:hydrogenase expression/formation protein HypC
MCLAIPGRILSLDGNDALVDVGGARTTVSVALIDDPTVGEWVVVHTGYALSRMDDAAAVELGRTLDAMLPAQSQEEIPA